jgi:multidrug efflux system membrane fusion protein
VKSKGDLLFTIDPRPSQAALARDQAQLENAQIQFDREQKLFDQKLVSQDEFDTSKSARDTLAADGAVGRAEFGILRNPRAD